MPQVPKAGPGAFANTDNKRSNPMDISTKINERLWDATKASYEAGNYTGAILDSTHWLTDLIRDKSGLDSDGNGLIGAAFGGQNPIVKVNSFQTESERDEQRGVEQLLRGIYTAIRNPRSHEKHRDTIETAEVLISFINYLASLIDKSRSPFDTKQIISRVFDKHFAKTEVYADSLAAQISRRKLLDVIIEVFKRRSEGEGECIVLFVKSVLKNLDPNEQILFWQIVSDSLEVAIDDSEYISVIQIAELDWSKISELARLRTEHRLIESIKEGQYNRLKKVCMRGVLGTWACNLVLQFTLTNEFITAVTSKLHSDDQTIRNYALMFCFDDFHNLVPKPPTSMISNLKKRLEDHDEAVFEALLGIVNFVNEGEMDEWTKAFKEPLEDFVPF